MKEILVHCCCGPCSTASIEMLLELGWSPVLYYRNDNIDTKEENDLRYVNLETVASHYGLKVIRETYDHDAWLEAVKGYEGEREGGARCGICFDHNLKQAYEKARELGFEHFCTTLTVSRYKNSPRIFRIGEKYEGFEPIDFKKKGGYEKSIRLSRELGLYRQHYCGCEFSKNNG